MQNKKKLIAFTEILLADFFWGFGFVATTWTLLSFSPWQSLYLRFTLIFLLSFPFVFFSTPTPRLKSYFRASFLPALFLFGEIFFQILGLKYTTPSKAGFITTLFIVLVPICEKLIYKTKIPRAHWFWVLLALVGTYFIVGGGINGFNIGDILLLISACFVSFHILIISWIADRELELDLFKFNLFQSYWCCLFAFPFIIFDPLKSVGQIQFNSVVGLLSLTFGTTILAFYFQLRAQQVIGSVAVSLLFLLESPLASFFSFIFLGEVLSNHQLAGCALVLAAAVGVIYTGAAKKESRT